MTTTPMTKAEWLQALAAEGLEVIQQGDWWNRERDDETGKVFGPVNGATIHHTAGTNSLNLVINGTSALPGPLCHTYIPKSGLVYMISGGRANHAGTFAQNAHDAVLREDPVHPYPDSAEPVDGNDKYYGLEAENLGDGGDNWPWKQYVAMVKWATAICRHHGWTQNSVIGHKEGTRRKVDPKGWVIGPDGVRFELTMDRFRGHVDDALALPAGQWQGTQEEDVALTDDEIRRIAERVWELDDIPAAAPPYSNSDYADGNVLWSARYALGDAVLKGRQARAEIAEVKAKVDALATGGVDLDALAVKVADELYRRMAE